MSQAKIGFIGLGQMGVPMVRCLLKGQYSVSGFDLNEAALASFAGEAAFHSKTSPGDVVDSSDVIIFMLPDSNVVDQLLWGDSKSKGIAQQLSSKQVLIDMGSSDPVRTRANAEKLKALGMEFVDAPVSGGVKRAVDGTLSIMIGGGESTVKTVTPILSTMGKTLTHVGPSGAGHAVKALNNYVSASGLLAVCEALVAAQKFGIDPHLANKVFNTSTGKNNTTDVKVENFMLSGTYGSGFSIALMRKDLQTALDFIDRMGTPDNFAKQCVITWKAAEGSLAKGADHTAMYKFILDHQ